MVAKDGQAPTSVSLFDQGLIQVLQASVTGLAAEAAIRAGAGGACRMASGPLEPLAAFMTNPAGAAIVNAVGPIRQLVDPSAKTAQRYLVVAPGDMTTQGAPVQVETQ